MEILVLIIVLIVLILVHEFGHFVMAKLAGMRVDEFGIGYPPRALVLFRKGETEYTLNWLPFGGFVRIFGEDPGTKAEDGVGTGQAEKPAEERGDGFADKNRFVQALVLVAGIFMNLLFAWILISASLAIGTPRALDTNEIPLAKDAALTVSDVLPGSPADAAGLQIGDTITQVLMQDEAWRGSDPAAFTSFVASDAMGQELDFNIVRNGKELHIAATPKTGTIAEDPLRPALGVGVAVVGTVPLAWNEAPVVGARYAFIITKETAAGLAHFFAGVLTFSADLSQIAGPVGIAGAVGTAAKTSFGALVSLTAIISINLALINILPFPALDGGRLLFVIIESITRRRIKPAVANAVNTAGFGLLVLLLIVVSVHDVWRLMS